MSGCGRVDNRRFRVTEIRRQRHQVRAVNEPPRSLLPTLYLKGQHAPKTTLLPRGKRVAGMTRQATVVNPLHP